MQASIAIISGQLATVDALPAETSQLSACTRGFAVGLHNVALQLETTSSQVRYNGPGKRVVLKKLNIDELDHERSMVLSRFYACIWMHV